MTQNSKSSKEKAPNTARIDTTPGEHMSLILCSTPADFLKKVNAWLAEAREKKAEVISRQTHTAPGKIGVVLFYKMS